MSEKRIQQIEFRLQQIKRALLEIGPMRPGSLTRQYKDPQHHLGAYWQISYTRRMKSRTEYVRKELGKGGAPPDRHLQALQTLDRPMARSVHRALRVNHADHHTQTGLTAQNSVLSRCYLSYLKLNRAPLNDGSTPAAPSNPRC